MITVKTKKGKWEDETFERELRWEECPNPKCPTGVLHYTKYMVNPHCPQCKTVLPGHDLLTGHGKRMAYHLEGP